MFWNKICSIFDILNKSLMSTEVIVKVNGEDVGVRENYHGEIFINKAIYLKHDRITSEVDALRRAKIVVKKSPKKKKDKE